MRPPKDIVLALLAANGSTVPLTEAEIVEDADGTPAGVTATTTTGRLAVSPEMLGWTTAELDDPQVKE